jgi:hypothetical protein
MMQQWITWNSSPFLDYGRPLLLLQQTFTERYITIAIRARFDKTLQVDCDFTYAFHFELDSINSTSAHLLGCLKACPKVDLTTG